MDEIEQLLKEKWSDWKSSFSKTNGSFSASPVYQGADKREKCKDFPMEYPLERKGFRYGPGWKKWSVFFLWIKKSCNFNEFQYCLCVSSMWKFQSVMFQQIDSRTSCVFSHPGETRIEKKKLKKLKKVQLLTFIFRKFNRSMISTFKEDRKVPNLVTPVKCNTKTKNDSADLKSARHVQF